MGGDGATQQFIETEEDGTAFSLITAMKKFDRHDRNLCYSLPDTASSSFIKETARKIDLLFIRD